MYSTGRRGKGGVSGGRQDALNAKYKGSGEGSTRLEQVTHGSEKEGQGLVGLLGQRREGAGLNLRAAVEWATRIRFYLGCECTELKGAYNARS